MSSLNPEVTQFLSAQPLKMFIGGRWIESESGQTFETFDPGRGEVLARVAAHSVTPGEKITLRHVPGNV